MRCLMCGKRRQEGSLRDLLLSQDPLCGECRRKWERKRIGTDLDGVRMYGSYVYNDAFSDCLIQFKELRDEALKDVFLYPVRKEVKKILRGYTLCLMPSDAEKVTQRGFSHLRLMFECLGMKMIEPFEKTADVSQKELGPLERKQMSRMIRLKKGYELPYRIALCDDTVTTGSTVEGALSQIDRSKHKVLVYAVSVNKLLL